MRILLGVGMQGKAALYDLFNNPDVSEVVAADTDFSAVDAYITKRKDLKARLFEVKNLDAKAKEKGVAILPEFGMDPGIDLVLLGEAIRSVDKVESVMSYGAGFPETAAANNPIKYKVTWRFEGVLSSYKRAGRVIRNGSLVDIAEDDKRNIEITESIIEI